MDSFELNKVMGALLGTCLITLTLNITAGAVFSPKMPAKPGYEIAVPEHLAGDGNKAGPQEPEVPLATLLASADASKGQGGAKVCLTCHTFEKNGPNKIGPNLWGIVGRKKASHPGFNYTAAMKSQSGDWTVDQLNVYLTNPKAMVPGTAMSFAGIPRANARADVIAYLNTLADNPAPLPKAADAAPNQPPNGAQNQPNAAPNAPPSPPAKQ